MKERMGPTRDDMRTLKAMYLAKMVVGLAVVFYFDSFRFQLIGIGVALSGVVGYDIDCAAHVAYEQFQDLEEQLNGLRASLSLNQSSRSSLEP